MFAVVLVGAVLVVGEVFVVVVGLCATTLFGVVMVEEKIGVGCGDHSFKGMGHVTIIMGSG